MTMKLASASTDAEWNARKQIQTSVFATLLRQRDKADGGEHLRVTCSGYGGEAK
ncbi:MAG: hypothetical protein JSV85_07265 [Candidatus Bathyarchaeota archaeon]|nr:MAG: hypothetical protein JSV85_07265 [Candidatus Bathyarchaeota archaeon]